MGNYTRGYGLLEKYLAKKRAIAANKLIPPDLRQGRILDIGCGTFPYFLTNTSFKEKFGLDPAVDHNHVTSDINLIQGDIEINPRLDFDDNFFDVVTMLAVFEHIKPDKLVILLKEINRVLKPSGRYILTTPAPWGNKLLWLMARMRLVSPAEIDEHENGYHCRLITDYLTQTGFNRQKIKYGYFELFQNSWLYAEKC